VGVLTMLSDTGDQVMCTVGQTDGHSIPDHTTSCADVQWDRIGSKATLLMPLEGLTGSIMVLHDLTGSDKPPIKQTYFIYTSFFIVSG